MKTKKHKVEAEQIKNFIYTNKIFVVIMVLATIIIVSAFFSNDKEEKKSAENFSSISSEIASDTDDAVVEKVDTNINSDTEKEKVLPKWRFYWIDLWIFLLAGGFCIYKILQEKKRAREKLK